MSKKRKKSIPTQPIKDKSKKYFCGSINGLDCQLNASNKLGKHSNIVRSGCGIIDNKEKVLKKEQNNLKKYFKEFY